MTFSVCDIQQRNVFSCSSFHYSFSDIPSSCRWSGPLVDILRLRYTSRFSWSSLRGLLKQRGLHGITKKKARSADRSPYYNLTSGPDFLGGGSRSSAKSTQNTAGELLCFLMQTVIKQSQAITEYVQRIKMLKH